MQLFHDASPNPVEKFLELCCVWSIGSRRLPQRQDGREVQGHPLMALRYTLVMRMMKMADVSEALSNEKESRSLCLHQAGTLAP